MTTQSDLQAPSTSAAWGMTTTIDRAPLLPRPEAAFYMAARLIDHLAARVADLERRVALLEGVRPPVDPDAVLSTAEAARVLGYTIHGFYRLLDRDPELARCSFRAPGKRSRMKFSREALERYKAARASPARQGLKQAPPQAADRDTRTA